MKGSGSVVLENGPDHVIGGVLRRDKGKCYEMSNKR